MSQENVEIVRRMYQAYLQGDADGALAYFDPQVEADNSRRVGGGIGHGREELRGIVAEYAGAFEEFREEIEEMRDKALEAAGLEESSG